MRDEEDTGGAGCATQGTAEQETHRTSTVEHGSFAHAACSCGWRGPARRARERARGDALRHLPG